MCRSFDANRRHCSFRGPSGSPKPAMATARNPAAQLRGNARISKDIRGCNAAEAKYLWDTGWGHWCKSPEGQQQQATAANTPGIPPAALLQNAAASAAAQLIYDSLVSCVTSTVIISASGPSSSNSLAARAAAKHRPPAHHTPSNTATQHAPIRLCLRCRHTHCSLLNSRELILWCGVA